MDEWKRAGSRALRSGAAASLLSAVVLALGGLIENRAAAGPLNATAPQPGTNAEFTRSLGRALGRPAFMPAPAFALNILLGEMAEALLLSGQRAVPAQAEHLGYRFTFTQLDDALRSIFHR